MLRDTLFTNITILFHFCIAYIRGSVSKLKCHDQQLP